MTCSICGRVIVPAFPMHQCAVPVELEGMEEFSVWADPGEDDMLKYEPFECLDSAVKYARKLMKKFSDSEIVIQGSDEDGHFSCRLSEINEASTLNLQRGLKC
ncbi:hypothetical protein LCGC14_2711680 [marine sediment metagenome]|uniref:Uncharacterized protein n=1 Tax=marine sediment metagenome TaxID=412755 RepID=A0A0F8ZCP8_9ZZZZ